MIKSEKVLGIKINTGLNITKAVEFISQLLNDTKYHTITTTNPEFILSAQEDADFKDIINNSDLSLPALSAVNVVPGVILAAVLLKEAINFLSTVGHWGGCRDRSRGGFGCWVVDPL